jgi:putative integral membrane protein (TIGR02587 family)
VALSNLLLVGAREIDEDEPPAEGLGATARDLASTALGAIFVSFSIAPTDEIPMLAAASSPAWLLALIFASVAISYGIVFEAGFVNQQRRLKQQGIFQKPMTETVVAYLISLAVAAGMLWFFDRLGPGDAWSVWLSDVLLLGLPAAIGGAAGRLAL